MHVLAIDIGNYSVKYISSFVEKRKVTHTEMSEIIVLDYMVDHSHLSELDAQAQILKEIIDTVARPDTRIIYQSINEQVSTRYLTLPVKSKKKADLMLPFQLEEDIPFALNEIHFAHKMESAKTQSFAHVSIVKRDDFETFYKSVNDLHCLPNILTSEASVIENFFHLNPIAGPSCVLDIGHKTTKAYFFYNSRLIVSHISYMGGKDITEMISQTYKIDPDEAVFYKHQNAFVLTTTQYEEVDQAQREFAEAMDKTFQTLLTDFARWRVGLKVNFNLVLQNIFITGGTSNIKNLSNYFAEKWNTKVVLLETFDKVEAHKIDLNPKNKSKYALVNMMAYGMKKKNRFINFLTGKYAQASSTEIPLHSFAFIGVRVAAVCLVFVVSLFVERYFISNHIKFVNTKLNTVIKNDAFNINARLRRGIVNQPKPVMTALTKKHKTVRQEISVMQSAIQIKALSPLVTLTQIAATSKVTLVEFSSNDMRDITAKFIAEDEDQLTSLKDILERSPLNNVEVQINTAQKLLHLTATEI